MSLFMVAGFFSCKKTSGPAVENPYNNQTNNGGNNKDTTNKNVSASSIEGLHRDIFKPTCSNSGCHDGTFEPDFRTVQSTYYSLVNQKPIKNDPGGTFNARVLPGNSSASILVYRMTNDLGGNSGIMPLVLDPGSNYNNKKAEHIANIEKWINDGATDIDGNSPTVVDFPPQILGVQVLQSNSALPRGGKYEPIIGSANTNVELWFSLADDKKTQSQLSNMTINWSTNPNEYDPMNEKNMSIGTTKNMPGLYASSIPYEWFYSFSTAGYKSGDVIWFRITCSDGSNTNYQLPNENSMFFLKKYFAIKIP